MICYYGVDVTRRRRRIKPQTQLINSSCSRSIERNIYVDAKLRREEYTTAGELF
jgi:hypothetical protein